MISIIYIFEMFDLIKWKYNISKLSKNNCQGPAKWQTDYHVDAKRVKEK